MDIRLYFFLIRRLSISIDYALTGYLLVLLKVMSITAIPEPYKGKYLYFKV